MKVTATIKSFKEIFPEIDLREFEALRSLSGDQYNIEITVNGAKYSLDLEGRRWEIQNIYSESEIDNETIYICTAINSNGICIDDNRKLYGKWLKSIKTEDRIPYENVFKNIMNYLLEQDEKG